ncbi:MAG: CheR family methyltransferase [Pseudonocardia sp.]
MTQPDPGFEELLAHLRDERGFDLTGYKRTTLNRRFQRRMEQLGIDSHGDYLDHLQMHAEEFTALFNTILINVTAFYRDPDAWASLAGTVLPELLLAKGGGPVRVWSAGCASGEEAYTLAMVLADALGPDEFRRRVKIDATDVDERALAQSRQASYSQRDVHGVDAEHLKRYFEQVGERWVFRPELRRSVIFGRNDLVQDAPISRIDLLVCRNTLMYFNAETQARILSRFHFALGQAGVLFLGKAEMLLTRSPLYAPADLRHRIFRKVPRPSTGNGIHLPGLPATGRAQLPGLELLRDEALLTGPLPQVVVTADGRLAHTNHQAERMFAVSARDAGRPFRDLEVSHRPVDLRPHIEQAQAERRPVRVDDVRHLNGGQPVVLEITVTPLVIGTDGLLGTSIVFADVTAVRLLRDELEQTNRQLETAYEELQSTNEELETTNEELQSTVEELETTNEELQSTNEELETMNEELQSTNDELQGINDELQDRSADFDQANAFLTAIVSSLRAGVVVLGTELQVQVWNRRSEELWGLRTDEALGEHFLNLDIGLPVDRLRPLIRRTLAGDDGPHELGLPAVNRRGRPISVRVLGSPLRTQSGGATGVILMMEHDDAPIPSTP